MPNMNVTAEQVIEAASAKHPDAEFIGPIYCVHAPSFQVVQDADRQHFELIVSKRVKRWLLWPVWSRMSEERIATYRATTLVELFAKLGGREV